MTRIVSISTLAYDGHPLEVALAEIAALGADHVELAFVQGYVDFDETAFEPAKAAEAARRLAEAGLSSVALSGHVNTGLPEAVDQLKRRLDFAHRIGAGMVIANAAPRAQRDRFLRNMERILSFLEEVGGTLALENAGLGADNLITTAADAVPLVDAIGSPRIRLNYDFGNTFTYNHETVRPETDFEAALPVTAHFHVKDVASGPSGWSFPAIGDGAVDYPRVFDRLAALGNTVPVGIELPLRLSRPGRQAFLRSPDPLPLPVIRDAVARSLRRVRALSAQAGSGAQDAEGASVPR